MEYNDQGMNHSSGGGDGRSSVEFQWVVKGDGGRKLLDRLMPSIREDPDNTFIILPTERMVSRAKRHVAEKMGGGFTSGIMTPRKFARHLYVRLEGTSPLGGRDLRDTAVRRIMNEVRAPHLKSRSVPIGGMAGRVSGAIGELLLNGIDPGRLGRTVKGGRAKDLHEIFTVYMSLLRERRIVDRDLLPAEIGKLLELRPDGISDLMIGIYMPGRMDGSYVDLFRSVSIRCAGMFVEEHGSREKPGFIDEVIEPPSPGSISIPPADSGARQMIYSDRVFRSIEARDRIHEVREICRFIKGRCTETDLDPGDFTVVFPRRSEYEKLVGWIFPDFWIPYSMKNDLRIGEIPSVSCVMDLLRSALDGFPRSGIIRSLSGPYLNLEAGGVRFSGIDIETATRRGGIFGGGRDHIVSWIDPLRSLVRDGDLEEAERDRISMMIDPLNRLLDSLSDLVSVGRTVEGHVGALVDILTGLSYIDSVRNEDGGGIGFRAVDSFMGVLSDMMTRDRILGPVEIDFPEFLNLLGSAMRNTTVSTGGDVGVSIVGLGEFTGMGSENVILGGLTMDNIPYPPEQFRLLSDQEREELELPPVDSRRASLEDLCISLTSVTDPILSFYTTSRESSVSMSPLIEELKTEAVDTGSDPRSLTGAASYIGERYSMGPGSAASVPDPDPYDRFHLESYLTGGSLIEGCLRGAARRSGGLNGPYNGFMTDPAVMEDLRSRYDEDRIWSASRLEGYRECPFRYFVEHILHIKPLEDMEPEVPPERKGIILHAVLEKFYDSWMEEGRDRIDGDTADEAFVRIRKIAMEELEGYQYRGPFWDALRDVFLGYDLNGGILRDFVDHEAEYGGPFRVRSTEYRFGEDGGVRIGGIDPGCGFRIQGFIDRVDLCPSETGDVIFIWDYKTGAVRNTRDSLQVPLYLAALGKVMKGSIPGGGGYYRIPRKGGLQRITVQGKDIWRDGPAAGSYDREIGRIEGDIERKIDASLKIIDGIRSGAFPRKERCRNIYCQLSGICRKGEW